MKTIKKAVIPVAGFGTRFLPFTKAMPKEMLPIVDTPTIQFIVEEAVKSGITDIIFVTASHSNKRAIEDHFDKSHTLETTLTEKEKFDSLKLVQNISNLANIHYVRQKEARGLGDAILCAKSFIGDEPFALLLGDDIVKTTNETALTQLIKCYNETSRSVMGVQSVEDSEVSKYGIVACDNKDAIYSKMSNFIEKPNLKDAPSNLAVLGRYILTPTIFKYLETQTEGAGNEIQLTDAVKRMMNEEDVYACVFKGRRYDIGDKLGFLIATVDYALENDSLNKEFLKYLKTIVK